MSTEEKENQSDIDQNEAVESKTDELKADDKKAAAKAGQKKSTAKKSAAKKSSAKKASSKEKSDSKESNDYAVIRSGGKQYTVSTGEVLSVEKLPGDVGDKIEIADVLMLRKAGEKEISFGTPVLAGTKVSATIVEQYRGPKLTVFKKRRRKGYTNLNGHRQAQTRLKIESIG